MGTLKDYLEEGGIKGRSFIDNYNNPGREYTVLEICPPSTTFATESESRQGMMFMKIRYGNMPSTTAVGHHLNDLEAKVAKTPRAMPTRGIR